MKNYQDLVKELREYIYWLGSSGKYAHDIHPKVCDEAADAIEELCDTNTVRAAGGCYCVDCDMFHVEDNGEKWCGRMDGISPEEDDFCSFGKSKKDAPTVSSERFIEHSRWVKEGNSM